MVSGTGDPAPCAERSVVFMGGALNLAWGASSSTSQDAECGGLKFFEVHKLDLMVTHLLP